MLVIAYYSRNTAYEREAALLEASLQRANMPYTLSGIDDRGGWYANTAYKAEFLRKARDKHGGPLVYVDVDAYVHENCEAYFDGLTGDFGAHYFRGPAKGHDQSQMRAEGWRLLSGTLFLGDTPKCRELLDAWCGLNDTFRRMGLVEGGGQKNLWYVTTCVPHLSIERLPGRYCWVFDKPWAYEDGEYPVIEHTIGSRDHRPRPGEADAIYERHNQARGSRIYELQSKIVKDSVRGRS